MHIKFVEIANFRKLRSVRIDLTPQTTLFVGANNSGKTSAMVALRYFLVDDKRFTMNDFTLSHWQRINAIGGKWIAAENADQAAAEASTSDWDDLIPTLDLWFHIEDTEIHHVSSLLPTLDWAGGLLGVRLRFEPVPPWPGGAPRPSPWQRKGRRWVPDLARDDDQGGPGSSPG